MRLVARKASHDAYICASLKRNKFIRFVAVHGLQGHPSRSWTSQKTGLFWLKDVLPTSFPQSRIMTFGYQDVLGAAAKRLVWALVNAMPATEVSLGGRFRLCWLES